MYQVVPTSTLPAPHCTSGFQPYEFERPALLLCFEAACSKCLPIHPPTHQDPSTLCIALCCHYTHLLSNTQIHPASSPPPPPPPKASQTAWAGKLSCILPITYMAMRDSHARNTHMQAPEAPPGALEGLAHKCAIEAAVEGQQDTRRTIGILQNQSRRPDLHSPQHSARDQTCRLLRRCCLPQLTLHVQQARIVSHSVPSKVACGLPGGGVARRRPPPLPLTVRSPP